LLFSRHLPNRIPEPGPALERQSAEPEPESGS
jgi:hypothetical protein